MRFASMFPRRRGSRRCGDRWLQSMEMSYSSKYRKCFPSRPLTPSAMCSPTWDRISPPPRWPMWFYRTNLSSSPSSPCMASMRLEAWKLRWPAQTPLEYLEPGFMLEWHLASLALLESPPMKIWLSFPSRLRVTPRARSSRSTTGSQMIWRTKAPSSQSRPTRSILRVILGWLSLGCNCQAHLRKAPRSVR